MNDDLNGRIHPYAHAVLQRCIKEPSLAEAAQKLLTAKNLKSTWARINTALDAVEPRFLDGAASCVIGAILIPLEQYGKTGTAMRPTFKVRIKQDYAKANSHLQRAVDLLRKAANELREAQNCSSFIPDDALSFGPLVKAVIETWNYGRAREDAMCDFYHAVRTPRVLDMLADRLIPNDDPWADVPGMISAKASWHDWLREAVVILDETNGMYNVDFSLQEADWVQLTKVLIGGHVTREAVKTALRSPHASATGSSLRRLRGVGVGAGA